MCMSFISFILIILSIFMIDYNNQLRDFRLKKREPIVNSTGLNSDHVKVTNSSKLLIKDNISSFSNNWITYLLSLFFFLIIYIATCFTCMIGRDTVNGSEQQFSGLNNVEKVFKGSRIHMYIFNSIIFSLSSMLILLSLSFLGRQSPVIVILIVCILVPTNDISLFTETFTFNVLIFLICIFYLSAEYSKRSRLIKLKLILSVICSLLLCICLRLNYDSSVFILIPISSIFDDIVHKSSDFANNFIVHALSYSLYIGYFMLKNKNLVIVNRYIIMKDYLISQNSKLFFLLLSYFALYSLYNCNYRIFFECITRTFLLMFLGVSLPCLYGVYNTRIYFLNMIMILQLLQYILDKRSIHVLLFICLIYFVCSIELVSQLKYI